MAKLVVPGVHNFTGLMAGRVYLIEEEDGLTLVDAGLALAPPRIVRQLEALGHAPGDVKRIFVTHAHPDHVGGLPELKRLTGAEVIASEVEKPFVEGEAAIVRPDRDSLSGLARFLSRPGEALPGTPVDRAVADGETLPGGWEVIFTPGHSPGHIALWHAEQRLLFCGDVIMRFVGLSLPFAVVTIDMAQNKRSIARLSVLEVEVVCFGHGEPLKANAAEEIRRFARKVGAM